ncbi:hypothetical protein EJB05_09938 [Eragrostis curvula]|uniref:Uncharacterized protein n=1 Tax=Eragrostis curvula TaxID=38414 RepID=A0A5J9W685_9POAL|nr:hypothetical protein EJB05_09938 [Eragrostis curvula]
MAAWRRREEEKAGSCRGDEADRELLHPGDYEHTLAQEELTDRKSSAKAEPNGLAVFSLCVPLIPLKKDWCSDLTPGVIFLARGLRVTAAVSIARLYRHG